MDDILDEIRQLCEDEFDNSPMVRTDDYQLGKNVIVKKILAILDGDEDD